MTTTKKSIMFQIFLRYEFLCITKPKARIFRDASTQNMARKYTSVFSLRGKFAISANQSSFSLLRLGVRPCKFFSWYRQLSLHSLQRPHRPFKFTNLRASIVLSPFGKCSSRAKTTQFAMIVNKTAYSKGGHSIINFV